MSNDLVVCADVQENLIVRMDKDLLAGLLMDRSTGKNIIWATSDYADLGEGYQENDEITIEAITGANGEIIKPRSVKSKEEQAQRVRNMAEVFTPLWICNKQNNLVDDEWFGTKNVFNEEHETSWTPSIGKVQFPDYEQHSPKGWESYIGSKRLEITCGEAPYLVSRYDTVTGELIPVSKRVGILDRKFRVINERVRNFKNHERTKHRWLYLALKAVRSTYGFEWSGDNLLLARENVLYTVIEYYRDKFDEEIEVGNLFPFVEVISWNIWQMDGIKCVVPNSCHEYVKEHKAFTPNIFDTKAFSEKTLKRSLSFCDVNEDEIMKCQGCLKDDVFLHNGVYCKIKNWSTGKIMFFKDLMNGLGSDDNVGNKKDFKFDVVIGNPPYQDIISTGDNSSLSKQLFPYYVKNCILLEPKYLSLIIPSRWFTADAQDKSFIKLREFIKGHQHMKKICHYADGRQVFPAVTVGSVNYFLYDRDYNGLVEFTECTNQETNTIKRPLFEEGLDIILSMNEMVGILDKVRSHKEFISLTNITYGRNAFGIVGKVSTLKAMSKDRPFPGSVSILCAYEEIRYTERCNVVKNKDLLDKWKVFTSKGNGGAGNLNKEKAVAILGKAFVGKPNYVCTDSLIPLGPLNTEIEANNLQKYMTTKFLRFMVGILKVSQNLYQTVYKYVPLQDFTSSSDIDWSKSVAEIDQQLYKKYGLSAEEIEFIEKNVKEMV